MEAVIPKRKQIWKRGFVFSRILIRDFSCVARTGPEKTTWIKQYLVDTLIIDLLAPEVYRIYSARSERLREVSEAQESDGTIVIDEVQKVPQLLDVVH